MSNPSENRAYFDTVQDYFLERTGRGLMLSSRDLELLIGWRDSGATATVVCEGIDAAVTSLNRVPRDLYAVRKYVDPKRNESVPAPQPQYASVPDEAPDPWRVALDRLSDARVSSARRELDMSYSAAERRVTEARDSDSDPWRVLYDLDDWLVGDLFDRLAESERRLIDLEIEGQHGAHLAVMSEEARSETVLQSRRKVLRDRLGLISLIE